MVTMGQQITCNKISFIILYYGLGLVNSKCEQSQRPDQRPTETPPIGARGHKNLANMLEVLYMAVRPADDSGYRIGCLGPLVNSRQLGSSRGGD